MPDMQEFVSFAMFMATVGLTILLALRGMDREEFIRQCKLRARDRLIGKGWPELERVNLGLHRAYLRKDGHEPTYIREDSHE
jgi:hypothetical protein